MISTHSYIWTIIGAIGSLLCGLGTFVSAGLLYRTFRKEQEFNQTQQRFNAEQSFQNNFFALLDSYEKIKKDIVNNSDANFGKIFSRNIHYDTEKGCYRRPLSFEDNIVLRISNELVLRNYFRICYVIVRFVDEAEIEENKKEKYIQMFRARLTDYEVACIFLNCIEPLGKKLYNLIKNGKHALLKNMRETIIGDTLKNSPDYNQYYNELVLWSSNLKPL